MLCKLNDDVYALYMVCTTACKSSMLP